jgi:hypothetical protein
VSQVFKNCSNCSGLNNTEFKQCPKCLISKRKYKQTEKGKAAIRRYNQTEKRKAAQCKYNHSEKGKAVRYAELFTRNRKRNPACHLYPNALTVLQIFDRCTGGFLNQTWPTLILEVR